MVMLHGERVETLTVPPESLGVSFPVSFEVAAAVLRSLPRLFHEPDGSFVWVAPDDGDLAWQVDGQLYDRQERVIYVELNGSCPQNEFDQLLQAFGWPGARFLFQLRQPAVCVGESEFRRWAALPPTYQ